MRRLISWSHVRISDVEENFANSRLVSIFPIALHRAAFSLVLTSVCEAKLRLSVKRKANSTYQTTKCKDYEKRDRLLIAKVSFFSDFSAD